MIFEGPCDTEDCSDGWVPFDQYV